MQAALAMRGLQWWRGNNEPLMSPRGHSDGSGLLRAGKMGDVPALAQEGEAGELALPLETTGSRAEMSVLLYPLFSRAFHSAS